MSDPNSQIPYQINGASIVAVLPDGQVEFLHPAALPLLELHNSGVSTVANSDLEKLVLRSPAVDLDRFHLTAPAIAFIETTNLCNLRCDHCYAWSAAKRPDELRTEEIVGLLDEFAAMGVLQVFLTGGEVFARRDAVELIQHAKTKPFSTQIFTNGTLIDEKVAKAIPRGTSFFISFDTADPERTVRGRMDFPTLRRVFDTLDVHGHVFRTAISVHRKNLSDAEEIFEWCAENGYPRPQWLETHPIGRALLNPHILMTREQVSESFEVYKHCMDRFTEDATIGIDYDDSKPSMRSVDTIKFCQRLENATRQEKCGRSLVYVDSGGSVFPCSNCMSAGMHRAGSIRDAGFRPIWENGFDAFRQITFDDFKQCASCDVNLEGVWCQFRCPPLSRNLTGDPLKCGATEYLRRFMVLTAQYWEERRVRGRKLSFFASS